MNLPSYEISLSPPVRLRPAFKSLDRSQSLNLFMIEFVQDSGKQLNLNYSKTKTMCYRGIGWFALIDLFKVIDSSDCEDYYS